jgi:glycosyltransferase involved in cell wall biosynthesis
VLAHYSRLEAAAIRLERLAGRLPDLVIANSESGAASARRAGFRARRVATIANGIDTDSFRPPSPEERAAARALFGFPEAAAVIAVVARLDPMKDHTTFLGALAILADARPRSIALIAGDGLAATGAALRRLAEALGVADRVVWIGARQRVLDVYHAADLFCLPSAFGEGFPNVVGEAMACGLPCVVTAVGDSARVVGDTGIVVPPADPQALARAMLDCMKLIGKSCPPCLAARDRIVKHFTTEAMISATESILLEIAASRRQRRLQRASC